MTFAEKLRVMRAWRGLLQVELSEKSGVPSSYISHLEAGRMIPKPAEEESLRQALGWDEAADRAFAILAGEAETVVA